MKVCAVEDCDNEAKVRGWCTKHYTRWRRHGSVYVVIKGRTWVNSNGYAIENQAGHPLADSAGRIYIHRRVLFDAIGDGSHPCNWCGKEVSWGIDLHVDHVNEKKADNRLENLVPSCQRCNMARSRPLRTTCQKGHAYAEDTPIRRRTDGTFHRECQICYATRVQRSYQNLLKRRAG